MSCFYRLFHFIVSINYLYVRGYEEYDNNDLTNKKRGNELLNSWKCYMKKEARQHTFMPQLEKKETYECLQNSNSESQRKEFDFFLK